MAKITLCRSPTARRCCKQHWQRALTHPIPAPKDVAVPASHGCGMARYRWPLPGHYRHAIKNAATFSPASRGLHLPPRFGSTSTFKRRNRMNDSNETKIGERQSVVTVFLAFLRSIGAPQPDTFSTKPNDDNPIITNIIKSLVFIIVL